MDCSLGHESLKPQVYESLLNLVSLAFRLNWYRSLLNLVSLAFRLNWKRRRCYAMHQHPGNTACYGDVGFAKAKGPTSKIAIQSYRR
jgi:hypothetical protein